jgi:DNA-binding NarL/FixJ family response regulator
MLPKLGGFAVFERIRRRAETPVIMLTARGTQNDRIIGLELGADDYVAKPIARDRFLARVRRLLARSPMRPVGGGLTPRELEVLQLLVDGLRPSEIAERLCITPKTTSSHIEHILAKLGAHSQAQAIAFAIRDEVVNAA